MTEHRSFSFKCGVVADCGIAPLCPYPRLDLHYHGIMLGIMSCMQKGSRNIEIKEVYWWYTCTCLLQVSVMTVFPFRDSQQIKRNHLSSKSCRTGKSDMASIQAAWWRYVAWGHEVKRREVCFPTPNLIPQKSVAPSQDQFAQWPHHNSLFSQKNKENIKERRKQQKRKWK